MLNFINFFLLEHEEMKSCINRVEAANAEMILLASPACNAIGKNCNF